MKTFAICYKRTNRPKAMRHTQHVEAKDFFAAVDIIKAVSADDGPVIYFVIELPQEDTNELG